MANEVIKHKKIKAAFLVKSLAILTIAGLVVVSVPVSVSAQSATGGAAVTGSGGQPVPAVTGTGGRPVPVLSGSGGTGVTKPTSVIKNPLKVDSIDELLSLLVEIALAVGAILAVLALIWVGIKFILAQGDPTKLKEARSQLKYVIIGIAILFGAKVIVEILKATISPFVDVSQLGNKP